MIHNSKAQLAGDFHNAVGRQAVGFGGDGQPGGMVVGQDDCGGVLAQDRLDDLTGVNTSRIDGPRCQNSCRLI